MVDYRDIQAPQADTREGNKMGGEGYNQEPIKNIVYLPVGK